VDLERATLYGMKEIFIDVPVCNQRNLPPEWAWRGCAICSLWMLLKWHGKYRLAKPQGNPVRQGYPVAVLPAELLKEGLAINGYLENVGWKHNAIVELAAQHGLLMDYAKKFFYSDEEKERGLKLIAAKFYDGKPVIASIFKELNHSKDGHMVVIRGMKEFSGSVIGLDIQDPDPSWRGHNYFLSRQEFFDGWRGGLIWPK